MGGGRKRLTRPPSRLNPNIIRLLDVRENNPQCQTQRMIKVKRTMAPSSPNTSTKICKTGWPYAEFRVLSKFWMENRKAKRTKKPKKAENPTELMTPIGALHDAFRVSSDRCAEASKPVMVY